MRTIKFRGKSIETSEWIFGYLNEAISPTKSLAGIVSKLRIGRTFVDADTIGQFTGLTDKDGREIYEGDIVECVSWNEYFTNPTTGETMEPFRRKMRVEFRSGGFKMVEPMPQPMRDNEWDIIYNGDIEVIGNVHDCSATQGEVCQSKNPELLNNSKQL